MKKLLWLIVCLMTMITSVKAQNSIVNEFKTDELPKQIDRLLLSPNKSIKENYAKVDSLISLHKETNYSEYSIMVEGHYTNKRNDFYNWPIGFIRVKSKRNDIVNEFKIKELPKELLQSKWYETIENDIIHILSELYAHSLDVPFDVDYGDYNMLSVNKKRCKVATGRTFKRSDGKITKEYVEKEVGGNTLYHLFETSSLYKKIRNKVISETNLQNKPKEQNENTIDRYIKGVEVIGVTKKEANVRECLKECDNILATKNIDKSNAKTTNKNVDDMYF